ncbi:PqiC family protein [Candidatus Nitronereus thalassa]|uniref:PqiC family protein n=1 Tax=Candidatus Nitronereus thalassa TaxID=3020898 RepID=A0ABU3K9M1_9BACT|nr:PqiC family protein [Candidatus Nitronereus thalassa]MDT7043114.1 PqiC family protein [Candidatus Nitronereus thalassa]
MNKNFEYWKSIGVILVCLSLGGCTATSQPSKFYLLNSYSSTKQAIAKAPEGLAVGVGPLTIPEYVDRPQIVTRVSTNELSLAEFHKWAEPLKDNIPQVLIDNLSVLLKTDHVVSYPWKRTTSIEYQVAIDITRFDATADGEAHLTARWYLYGEDTRTILDTHNSHLTAPLQGPDYASIVAALNRTLDELSQSIATSIVNVHLKKKK